MKKLLYAILLFIPILSFGQVNDSIQNQNTIAKLATELTGKWKLTGYYRKNGTFVEKQVLEQFTSDDSGNEYKEIRRLTKTGLQVLTYKNGHLIDLKVGFQWVVMVLDLDKAGLGDYEYFVDYDPIEGSGSSESCQPIPEIQIRSGKYYLYFVGMTGDFEYEFEIEGNKLILKPGNEPYRHFERIIEK